LILRDVHKISNAVTYFIKGKRSPPNNL